MLNCERCGVEAGFDDNAETRIQEVVMQFGITTSMCFHCRKTWNVFSTTHNKFQEYSEQGFRLRCWQAQWKRFPKQMDEAEEGVSLLRKLTHLDREIYRLVNNWIKAGATEEELQNRPESLGRDPDVYQDEL